MKDKSKIQSVIFSTDKWDIQRAGEWLLSKGLEVKKVDQKTKNFIRFRQLNPKPLENKGYHFVNKKLDNSGIELVLAYPPTIKRGGKLSVSQIRRFMNASYEKTPEEKIDDFVLDQELSNDYAKTYYNPVTNHAVVIHRGTSGATDWLNNVAYATGIYNLTPRYWTGRHIQKGAEQKYGAKNVSTLGHSQGAVLTRKLGRNSKEMITLNPAWLGERQLPNEYVIRSGADVVSSGLAPINWLKNKVYPGYSSHHNITIPRENLTDVIGEHSPEILKRLEDQDRMIGEGIPKHAYLPIMSAPITEFGGGTGALSKQSLTHEEKIEIIAKDVLNRALGRHITIKKSNLIAYLQQEFSPFIPEYIYNIKTINEINEGIKEDYSRIETNFVTKTQKRRLAKDTKELVNILNQLYNKKEEFLDHIIEQTKLRGGKISTFKGSGNYNGRVQDIYSPEFLNEILIDLFKFSNQYKGHNLNREKTIEYLREHSNVYENLLDINDDIEEGKEKLKESSNEVSKRRIYNQLENLSKIKHTIMNESVEHIIMSGGKSSKIIYCGGGKCGCGGNC